LKLGYILCLAVPLSHSHPAELLEYFVKDSDSKVIITTPEYEDKIKPIAAKLQKKLLLLESSCNNNALSSERLLEDAKSFISQNQSNDPAMIL
jgi:acyl-coenzyme A synthetase/AMP-(fatty) acid ligase